MRFKRLLVILLIITVLCVTVACNDDSDTQTPVLTEPRHKIKVSKI